MRGVYPYVGVSLRSFRSSHLGVGYCWPTLLGRACSPLPACRRPAESDRLLSVCRERQEQRYSTAYRVVASRNDSSQQWRLKPLRLSLKRTQDEGSPLTWAALWSVPGPGRLPRDAKHGVTCLGWWRTGGLEDFVRHLATTAAEIPARPDMAVPTPLAQGRRFGQQPRGAFALPRLAQLADGTLGRERDHALARYQRRVRALLPAPSSGRARPLPHGTPWGASWGSRRSGGASVVWEPWRKSLRHQSLP